MVYFIVLLILLYKIFIDNDRENEEKENKSKENAYINAFIVPMVITMRLSQNATKYSIFKAHEYIKNEAIPNFITYKETEDRVLEKFAKFKSIDQDLLYKYASQSVDTINNADFSYEFRYNLLSALFEICNCMDGMNKRQRDYIYNFAMNIRMNAGKAYDRYQREKSGNYYEGYSNDSYDSGYNRQNKNSGYNNADSDKLAKAYRTLGLDPSASNDEVKSKKNKLLRKWHPDLFATEGEEAIKKATETSQRINEAYVIIKEARGMN